MKPHQMDTSAGQTATAPTDRRPTPDFSDQKKASRAYGSIVLPAVLLWVAIVLSIVFFLVCLFHSRHWPILHDAAIMHYVVFLMDHGMLPYKDVIDINMPGAYMAEWFAIHVFGSGPLGWRGYDAFTMLIVLVSAAVIAPRGDRAAGLFGGLGACAFHLANGPIDVGQRDWIIMVLLFLTAAFLQECLRRGKPWMLFLSAVCCGFAATIKPLVIPSAVVFLLLAYSVLRKSKLRNEPQLKGKRVSLFMLAAVAGALVPTIAVLLFFLHGSTLNPFLAIVTGVTRQYVNSGNVPLSFMMHVALGVPLDLLLLLSVYIAVRTHSWRNWQYVTILLGVCTGAFLFFGQRKGWQYHKLSFVGFLMLWMALQFSAGMRERYHVKWISAAGLVLLCFLLIHNLMIPTLSYGYVQPAVAQLEPDLQRLGGSSLSGNIQCVEAVNGCINTLYEMRLMQSTGFIYDAPLFTKEPNLEVQQLRAMFLSKMQQRPPKVLVLMKSWGYDRVEVWPAFRSFLQNNYSIQAESGDQSGKIEPGNYRLYVQK